MTAKRRLGIIGGSGIYSASFLTNAEKIAVDTPWGSPSGVLTTGVLNGVEAIFLARHGEGHALPPGEINYRANIDAMKQLGATDLVSVSACGSFR